MRRPFAVTWSLLAAEALNAAQSDHKHTDTDRRWAETKSEYK